MQRILVAAFCASVVAAAMAEAQIIVQGPAQYKLSAVTFSKSKSGVVVAASLSPGPSEAVRLNLVVFAPATGASLAQLNVAGGQYAMTMDEVGDYFSFDLKADSGKGEAVGPLIIHALQKAELVGTTLKLALRHKLAVRENELFPTHGRLEVALATEGKDKAGKPQFTIVSNSASGIAK